MSITKAGRGLHGLVNNAGIGTGGPLMDSKQEEFELAMDVNALGPVRMTRAFGPLIIAAKGRIVNISSVSGILAGKNTSAYAMSKHAVEAFTDSLATEMQPRRRTRQRGRAGKLQLADHPQRCRADGAHVSG